MHDLPVFDTSHDTEQTNPYHHAQILGDLFLGEMHLLGDVGKVDFE